MVGSESFQSYVATIAVVAKAATVVYKGIAAVAVVAKAARVIHKGIAAIAIVAEAAEITGVDATGIAAWKIAANTNLIAAIAVVAEAARVIHEGIAIVAKAAQSYIRALLLRLLALLPGKLLPTPISLLPLP